jgi:pimeloyl-ACP methyl ester carboxylesterase
MPVEERFVEIEGARIETLAWGDPAKQPLLLMHGSMAHARWWQPVAQLLAKWYRVVSFSFSGMGGSDWRESYSISQMAREAEGVAEQWGLFEDGRRPVVLAHSFGGQAASILTHTHGERLLGTILVDSFVTPEIIDKVQPYKSRYYDDEAAALERFRFSPDEPSGLLYIVDMIARASAVLRDGRWTWRFDPDFFHKCTLENTWDYILKAQCRLAFMRGEFSTVALREDFDLQRVSMRADSQFVEIPLAYHHIMAEQPIALTVAIQAVVEGWLANLSNPVE